jgi:hypothetical protein
LRLFEPIRELKSQPNNCDALIGLGVALRGLRKPQERRGK